MKPGMKWMVLTSLAVLLMLLAACGKKSSPSDFYSMDFDESTKGTIVLGMTQEEERAAIDNLYTRSNRIIRFRYVDGVLKSVSSTAHYFHPVGITWDMNREALLAHFAKDSEVMVTEEPNVLTATKTIDGTLYYIRIVVYDDGTIKEVNQTVDPSLDELLLP